MRDIFHEKQNTEPLFDYSKPKSPDASLSKSVKMEWKQEFPRKLLSFPTKKKSNKYIVPLKEFNNLAHEQIKQIITILETKNL